LCEELLSMLRGGARLARLEKLRANRGGRTATMMTSSERGRSGVEKSS
jgi:hypothetical protein